VQQNTAGGVEQWGSNLKGITLTEALALIKAQRPDWYKTYSDLYETGDSDGVYWK
jgi:hypothetical protein